jgi:hypothetical protein
MLQSLAGVRPLQLGFAVPSDGGGAGAGAAASGRPAREHSTGYVPHVMPVMPARSNSDDDESPEVEAWL